MGVKSFKNGQHIANRDYIGEKSRRMQMRRKNLEKRREKEIEEKSGLLKNLESVEDLKIMPLKHYKEKIVSMEDCMIAYGEKEIIQNFNLEVNQGDRVFLKGKNGCGKSSILKSIDYILLFSGYIHASWHNKRICCPK